MVTAGREKKRLLAALAGRQVTPPPFWLMRQAGRYLPEYRKLRENAATFLDFCYRPELAVEATLQPVRRYGVDAAIVFSDILVVPDAMGIAVSFEPGRGPLVEPIRDSGDVAALDMAGLRRHLAPVYETLNAVSAMLDETTTLIGFAGAPWTVAAYAVEGGTSRDFVSVRRWAFEDPAGFGALIEKFGDAIAEHLIAQVEAGAEALQIFDSWAGILPEPAFRRWCVAPVRRIVDAVKAQYSEVPIIAFPRGAGAAYQGYARATGADAVGLDSTVPVEWAAKTLQVDSPVQGNLDPLLLVLGGDVMAVEVSRIVEAFGCGPHIFNLGHGVMPETPPENVACLASILRDASTGGGE